jgi:hypothetical protein
MKWQARGTLYVLLQHKTILQGEIMEARLKATRTLSRRGEVN